MMAEVKSNSRILLVAVVAVVVAIVFAACDNRKVYDSYGHTTVTGWEKNDKLDFMVPPLSETGDYLLTLAIRLSDAYPFRNLHMVVRQTVYPSQQVITDTVSCVVVDRQGSMVGPGVMYYQYTMPLRRHKYNAGDSLHISVSHNMKREILPGIADVGVILRRK